MTSPKTTDTTEAHRLSPGLGSLIGIGAGVGLVAGTLLGDLASGLLGGAAAGTLVGSVLELSRRPPPPAPPQAAPQPRSLSLRWLIGCLIFLGVSALAGSVALVGSPSGAALQIPLSILQYSPFSDFLIPGLILGIVFGAGSVLAILALRRRPAWPLGAALTRFTGEHWAWSAAVALGLGQIIWIVTETVMLRGASWLGFVYGGLGVLIVVLAFRPDVRQSFVVSPGVIPSRRPR